MFKFKYLLLFCMLLLLTACDATVSPDKSDIPYNKYYTDATIEKVSCGRGNQIEVSLDGKTKKFYVEDNDCSYILHHRERLKTAGEDTELNINFISNGKWIEGIVLND